MSKARYTLKKWRITRGIRGVYVMGTVIETSCPHSMPVGSTIMSGKIVVNRGTVLESEHAIYTLA